MSASATQGGRKLLASLGHARKFKGVRILAALVHGTLVVGVSHFATWYNEWIYGTFSEGAIYIHHTLRR